MREISDQILTNRVVMIFLYPSTISRSKNEDNNNSTIVNKDKRLQQNIHNCSNIQYRTVDWEQVKRSRDPTSLDNDDSHGNNENDKTPELLVCNLKMK